MGIDRHRPGCMYDSVYENCNCDMYATEVSQEIVQDAWVTAWEQVLSGQTLGAKTATQGLRAEDILDDCKRILAERGQHYSSDQERNMNEVVAAFNALSGRDLSTHEGWIFMAVLKLRRALKDPSFNKDHYQDGCNYIALAAEERAEKAP